MRYATFFTTFLLSLICLHVSAESYTVLHVRGVILSEKSGNQLKPGDKLDSEEKVTFKSEDAIAALFSSSKGRFTLSAGKKGGDFGEEFVSYVKSSLLPARKGLSTRAGKTLMNDLDITNHFGKDRWLILGNSRLTISKEAYPMSLEGFFYLRYLNEPQNAEVNKKIDWEEEEMILNWDELMMLGTEKTKPEDNQDYQLFYFTPATKQSKLFCYLHPIFPDEEGLIPEIQTMLKLETARRKGFDRAAQIKETGAYLEEYHGWTNPDVLKVWMDKHIPE